MASFNFMFQTKHRYRSRYNSHLCKTFFTEKLLIIQTKFCIEEAKKNICDQSINRGAYLKFTFICSKLSNFVQS
jgi:hypothetical protein